MAPPDSVALQRIHRIQEVLVRDRQGTDAWWFGWLAGYGAATAGQMAVFAVSGDTGTRQDMIVGAATTFLGTANQFITPLRTGPRADRLSALPESTPEEIRHKLAEAEAMLEKVALTERFGRSWKAHTLTGAVNLTAGLVTWLGFKRSVWAGVGNFALNTMVTEVQIWTQPMRTLKAYREYCRKYQSGSAPICYRPRPEFHLGAAPGGLSLRLVF
jgi:hypothetical protein